RDFSRRTEAQHDKADLHERRREARARVYKDVTRVQTRKRSWVGGSAARTERSRHDCEPSRCSYQNSARAATYLLARESTIAPAYRALAARGSFFDIQGADCGAA